MTDFTMLLLAAGRSTRMGRLKQLLPWKDGQPLVAAAFDAVRPVCSRAIVVLGHEADTVAGALGERNAHRVLSDGALPMYESLRVGLSSARALDRSAAVFLHLADHPAVAADTLRVLVDTYDPAANRAVIPMFQGNGGHPIVIPPGLIVELIDYHGEGGLRVFWQEHPDRCRRILVDDPGVTRDIDHPDEYARAVEGPGTTGDGSA